MDGHETCRNGRLRIGELAEIAGTTTRAIRHYHAIGLLAEPERDASGYRRYGPDELVRLVRVRRLRSVGLPLDRIAAALGAETQSAASDLRTALGSLADELSHEIERLGELRVRVLALAAASGLDDPIATWSALLRRHGLLDPTATLPVAEHGAVAVLDVVHPQGIEGVVAIAEPVLADPARARELSELVRRFAALAADADDDLVERLAADYVAAVPRPAIVPPAVDVEAMDKLLANRFSPAQLRCLHRIRQLFEERDR